MSEGSVVLLRITGIIPMDNLARFLDDMQEQGVHVQTAIQKGGYLCPLCHLVSFNPNDIENQYCGCCGNAELPKTCDHRRNV